LPVCGVSHLPEAPGSRGDLSGPALATAVPRSPPRDLSTATRCLRTVRQPGATSARVCGSGLFERGKLGPSLTSRARRARPDGGRWTRHAVTRYVQTQLRCGLSPDAPPSTATVKAKLRRPWISASTRRRTRRPSPTGSRTPGPKRAIPRPQSSSCAAGSTQPPRCRTPADCAGLRRGHGALVLTVPAGPVMPSLAACKPSSDAG
jgi:hypothetical protein